MKILVTDATGFISHHIIYNLLRRKVSVVASDVSTEMATGKDCSQPVEFGEHIINANAGSENLFEEFMPPYKLIHLAWTELPNYKERPHLVKNLLRQFTFLKNIVENGCKDLLVVGSCLAYGMKGGCLSEDMEPEPGNPYALAKDTLRKQLEELQKEHSFLFKWPQIFYLYGSGQNHRFLLSQLGKALQAN
jgi:nucleoside-diphosphate-sugar epimerase